MKSEIRNGVLVFDQPPQHPNKPDDGKIRVRRESIGCFSFICPGCGREHTYTTAEAQSAHTWQWNGSLSSPTFYPSMIVRSHPVAVCHFFVTNGRIEFVSDSTHALSGKDVELPEISPLG
jgi:hypothetical protein